MTIDPVRAECFEGGIKGSIFDHPSIRRETHVRWDSETVDASLHRERVLLGNVNRDTDVDKWGLPCIPLQVVVARVDIVLGMTRINNDDVELTVDEDVAYLVGR